MVNLMIPRRPSGEWVLPGRIRREKIYDFDGASVPSGVTTASGTTTPTDTSASRGHLGMATPATAAGQCKITLPALNLSMFEAVMIMAEGVRTPASGAPEGLSLDLSASGIGAFMRLDPGASAQGYPFIKYTGSSTSQWVPFSPFPAGRSESIDIGLLMLPARKLVYALVGDQVVGAAEFTGMTLGVINPAFAIITGTAEVKTASIARLRLVTRLD